MTITADPSRWYYSGERRSTYTTGLSVGDIIIWERKPYRVLEITPRAQIDWSPKYLEAWEKAGRPDPAAWWRRPFAMVFGKEFEPDSKWRQHLEAAGSHYWIVLPEHYSVCRLCGELPPCLEAHNERIFEIASEQFAEEMKILPGHCHDCQEFITRRQGSIRFEGANLTRPDLGDDSAIFHTRRKCFDAAFRYDQRWTDAVPGRVGKLSCPGAVVHHVDGSTECSLGAACAGPMDVLGEWMRHRGGESWHSSGRGYRDECWCTAVAAPEAGMLDAAEGGDGESA